MLPDFETCWKHINIYNMRVKISRPNTVNYQVFWEYKTALEKTGQNILDDQHIGKTAFWLHALLVYLKKQKTGIAGIDKIENILREIRPCVNELAPFDLGSGKIELCRQPLEAAYEKLGGINKEGDRAGSKSSIVNASEILMAVWGQVPRFDLLARKRFEKWIHPPAPLKLPYLEPETTWYRPGHFSAMIEELDRWVAAWPLHNDGRSFTASFYDLCPGAPAGRQVDIIYHWEYPDPRVDYRLLSQGS